MVGILTPKRSNTALPRNRSTSNIRGEGLENEKLAALKLKAENDRLRQDNKSLLESNRLVEAQTKKLEREAFRVRREIKDAESKREALRYEASRMEERLKRSTQLRQPSQKHPNGNQSIEMSVISKKPQLKALPQPVESLQPSLDNARAITRKNQEKLEAARAQLDQLLQQELSLREEKRVLEDELMSECRLHQQCKNDLQAVTIESESLRKECREARTSIAFLQDENNELISRLQASETTVMNLRNELSKKRQVETVQSNLAAEDTGASEQFQFEAFSDLGSLDSSLLPQNNRDRSDSSSEVKSTHMDIRIHAAKMLHFANRAIERGRSSRSDVSSAVSSLGSEFRPATTIALLSAIKSKSDHKDRNPSGKPPLPSRANSTANESQHVFLCDMEKVKNVGCSCQTTLFSGNSEHIEFYLPRLGLACTCGSRKNDTSTLEGADPTAISNILRPWQIEFLSSVKIWNCIDLVHAYNQRGGDLAKSMRKWRSENNLPSVKTKSCGIALHIWSQTCKAVIRSVRKEKAQGAKIFKWPEFLEVTNNCDGQTISTIGYGSISDMNTDLMEL